MLELVEQQGHYNIARRVPSRTHTREVNQSKTYFCILEVHIINILKVSLLCPYHTKEKLFQTWYKLCPNLDKLSQSYDKLCQS